MARIRRFNLVVDNCQISNLEELQENFCIEDILEEYHSKRLQKWLSTRNYDEELSRVEAIKDKKDFDIAKKLVKIFDILQDDKEIEDSLYILKYLEILGKKESKK